ncbi:procollagen C-endopeptidase enhancer 2-like [Branchiostoma lanceolatum]|uniref:procollagen C-endopeptidase enhancer 2-like n=1 Tax=Branchiostoma lanceolatum TaxID=7740 RepID=UPI003457074D
MAQLFFFAVLALAASVRGQDCVFPFTYGSTTYDSCTSASSTGFWCSLDAVYNGGWRWCDERECTFPFIYNGQTYTTCVPGGGLASPWCSLDAVYQGNYVSCSDDVVIVEPLDDKPEACHFPFEYQGNTYSTCTLEASSELWCSLDAVYDGNWKYCGEEDCVFPFTYNGESYDECVEDIDGGWCSLDHVYQGNGVSCAEKPCGETINKDHGVLTSPNYPNNYDHDMDCTTTIPARGGTIYIEFQDFVLEGGASTFGSCEFDYVEIFAGERSLGTWCGSYGPGNITSNQDVSIKMFTDGSIADKGWRLKYTVEGATPFGPGLEECGGLLHGQHGHMESPGFPVAYHDDIDCTWTLEDKHSDVMLEFSDFHLEKPGQYQGCSYDFVEIYHGLERVGRFCGNAAPPTTTYSEKVSIRFKTDQHTVGRGFRFNWTYLHPETTPAPPMMSTTDAPDGSGEGSGAAEDAFIF